MAKRIDIEVFQVTVCAVKSAMNTCAWYRDEFAGCPVMCIHICIYIMRGRRISGHRIDCHQVFEAKFQSVDSGALLEIAWMRDVVGKALIESGSNDRALLERRSKDAIVKFIVKISVAVRLSRSIDYQPNSSSPCCVLSSAGRCNFHT